MYLISWVTIPFIIIIVCTWQLEILESALIGFSVQDLCCDLYSCLVFLLTDGVDAQPSSPRVVNGEYPEVGVVKFEVSKK